MRKIPFVLVPFLLLMGLICSSSAQSLTIGGVVRQPLNMSSDDLSGFVSTYARVTDLGRNGTYGGVFDYQGVPLKTLLEMATIQKDVEGYSKQINLAIVVRNREGKSVALSWGEVFYKHPSNVIVATSARPFKKRNTGLRADEIKKRLERQREAEMKSLRDTLAGGKSVAVLDYGDPTLYGGWQHWLGPEFAERLQVVPGISALSAGSAMMGYNLACNQDSMIVTTPQALAANKGMLKGRCGQGRYPCRIYGAIALQIAISSPAPSLVGIVITLSGLPLYFWIFRGRKSFGLAR